MTANLMQSENERESVETDYELALRLAGMQTQESLDTEQAILEQCLATKATLNTEQATKAPIGRVAPVQAQGVVDVRVTALNTPRSILRKWGAPESSPTALDLLADGS